MSYADTVRERGYLTLTKPRPWTEEDLSFLRNFKGTTKFAAIHLKRSEVSVSIKRKRLKMAAGEGYNSRHLERKRTQMLEALQGIGSVADAFSGKVSWYSGKVPMLTSNDKRYGGVLAVDFLRGLDTDSYDLVDIDPFGSCAECYSQAARIARKRVIVTFGEYGHRRFKRLDFVSAAHGITSLEDFNAESLEATFKRAAVSNGKIAKVVSRLETPNIIRTVFDLSETDGDLL